MELPTLQLYYTCLLYTSGEDIAEWKDNRRFTLKQLFILPDFRQIMTNTVVIAVCKIVIGMVAAVAFAVLLLSLIHI